MKLTVLITTYNCALYINQAIKSILHQTFKDFELLIINDGSSDNTEEIVSSFKDSRIRYISRKHLGRSATLNFGLKLASADIIALMDADDIAHPERLEKQIKIVVGNENKICYTRAAYFLESDYIIKFLSEKSSNRYIKKILALHGFFCNSTMMFYKNHILKYGYDEILPSSEDYELLLRIKNISEFIIIPEILLFARLRNKSLSSTMYGSNKNIIYKIQEPFYQDLFSSFGINNLTEQWKLKGWREFFYGSKNLARKYWLNTGLKNWNLKLTFSFLLSLFPKNFFEFLKDKKVRLRIDYHIEKLFLGNKIQIEFNKICRMISE
jgi:glycosyltransferase involved in cell wall biosynthesis